MTEYQGQTYFLLQVGICLQRVLLAGHCMWEEVVDDTACQKDMEDQEPDCHYEFEICCPIAVALRDLLAAVHGR